MDQAENKRAKLGKTGELLAAEFLKSKGYRIICQNWRYKRDEIDIVAMHHQWMVFVEVKTRTGSAFGMPWESVDQRKQNAMVRAANAYITSHKIDLNVRFDIVSILQLPGQPVIIEIFENAFML